MGFEKRRAPRLLAGSQKAVAGFSPGLLLCASAGLRRQHCGQATLGMPRAPSPTAPRGVASPARGVDSPAGGVGMPAEEEEAHQGIVHVGVEVAELAVADIVDLRAHGLRLGGAVNRAALLPGADLGG
jgi:hypothetical protein